MLLRRNQLLFCDYPAKAVRDQLRQHADTFRAEDFDDDRLLGLLVEAGLVTVDDRGWYSLTVEGGQLRSARIGKPFARRVAERLLGEVVARGQAINDSGGPMIVRSIRVFGSYLDPAKDELGDLDLAVDVRSRRQTGLSYQELFAAYDKTRARLRNRSRYISLCCVSALEGLDTPWREVFAWDDGRRIASSA